MPVCVVSRFKCIKFKQITVLPNRVDLPEIQVRAGLGNTELNLPSI